MGFKIGCALFYGRLKHPKMRPDYLTLQLLGGI
jgi:hypothetical protein